MRRRLTSTAAGSARALPAARALAQVNPGPTRYLTIVMLTAFEEVQR
jgi:hypothetical protein